MFNADQREYVQYLATILSDERCWSGWCSLTRTDSSSYKLCSGVTCPLDVTLAERQRMACESCGNYPDAVTMRFTHNVSCSRERRRDFYASVDLGGEA